MVFIADGFGVCLYPAVNAFARQILCDDLNRILWLPYSQLHILRNHDTRFKDPHWRAEICRKPTEKFVLHQDCLKRSAVRIFDYVTNADRIEIGKSGPVSVKYATIKIFLPAKRMKISVVQNICHTTIPVDANAMDCDIVALGPKFDRNVTGLFQSFTVGHFYRDAPIGRSLLILKPYLSR